MLCALVPVVVLPELPEERRLRCLRLDGCSSRHVLLGNGLGVSVEILTAVIVGDLDFHGGDLVVDFAEERL